MGYRSILTYCDADDESGDRLEAAIAVARELEGHLTTVAFGYDPDIAAYPYAYGAMTGIEELYARAVESARERGAAADARLQRAGILGDVVTEVCTYAAMAMTFGQRARFADLVVLGRIYGEGADESAASALEGALFDGDSAVLACPAGTSGLDLGTVIVAWNESREALRAVRRALPLLRKAGEVEILMIGEPSGDADPAQPLATMLARHGAKVDVFIHPDSGLSVADKLRQRIVERGAGLVVMGAYGHSRFREYVLGGVTREILTEVPVPVLLAH